MSGMEWFFACISGVLMLSSFWIRQVEDRTVYAKQSQRRKPFTHTHHRMHGRIHDQDRYR